MLTICHSPGSCSTGILILLHEIGAPFSVEIVDLRKKEQQSEGYKARNPKGKVPLLVREDGSGLTEFPAIAYWLAKTYPEAGLWPEDLETQARTLETLDFVVSSLHMRGFTFVKNPQRFVAGDEARAALRAHGVEQAVKGFGVLSETLGDKEYLLGKFGLADAAACYALDWAAPAGIELPANLAALLARLRARPSVAAAYA